MTTSANMTKYVIRRGGVIVGRHFQHAFCKYAHHELLKYVPAEEHTIQAYWDDEDEVTHPGKEVSLAEFLRPYYAMGRRYRDGCTIEELYTAPRMPPWGFPDIGAIKKAREAQTTPEPAQQAAP